jgi:FlaG/FlaF family flagellin (archaellin)
MTEKIYQDPESAVSPVVGVMLMLVVASLLQRFECVGRGAWKRARDTPQTSIDVSFSGTVPMEMMFTHESGDTS